MVQGSLLKGGKLNSSKGAIQGLGFRVFRV